MAEKEKNTSSNLLYDVVSIVATAVISVAVVFMCVFRTVGVVGT